MHSAKPVRHAKAITVDQVRALATLPAPLLRARVAGFGLSADQTALLVECYRLIRSVQGETAAETAAQRWSGAADARGLFDKVEQDVWPEPPRSPLPESLWFKTLATKADIRDAAERYGNCLRGKVCDAVSGESVFLEWTGQPGAVLEIWRDPIFGWRLCEARLARNAAVPTSQRDEIVKELRRMGVLVGRSRWGLLDDLSSAGAADFKLTAEEVLIEQLFG